MNNNKLTSYMVVIGIVILGVFGYVATYNILSLNNSSNGFFSRDTSSVNASVDYVSLVDNKLLIKIKGDANSVCLKSTKSRPGINSFCWKDVKDNEIVSGIYEYKSYYIWLKDSNNNISDCFIYNYSK